VVVWLTACLFVWMDRRRAWVIFLLPVSCLRTNFGATLFLFFRVVVRAPIRVLDYGYLLMSFETWWSFVFWDFNWWWIMRPMKWLWRTVYVVEIILYDCLPLRNFYENRLCMFLRNEGVTSKLFEIIIYFAWLIA